MNKHIKAVAELKKYIKSSISGDVISTLLAQRSISNDESIDTTLAQYIIDISQGSMKASDIDDKLKQFNSKSNVTQEIIDKIKIFHKKSQTYDIKRLVNEQDSNVSLFCVNTVRLTPTSRNIDSIILLLTSIPTHEINKCVPYFSLNIHSPQSSINDDGHAKTLTLHHFLEGNTTIAKSGADNIMLSALNDADNSSMVGMELFTSPQTLVNATSKNALDVFRPFLSLDKFEVNVEPQVGFYSFRTATLNITLHDRSRLHEIAEFIRPDLYGKSKIFIEYGWSCQENDDNYYSAFLNSLKIKEVYGIINSYMSFENNSVKLKIKLYSKGYTDILLTPVSASDKLRSSIDSVTILQQTILKIRNSFPESTSQKQIKEIRPTQKMISSLDDISSTLDLGNEMKNALKTFLKKSKKNASDSAELATLKETLIKLYGESGNSGVVKTLKDTITQTISSKIDNVKANIKDDVLLTNAYDILRNTFEKENLKHLLFDKNEYVSFGKLMAIFVGQPLETAFSYEEVQLLFYPFNSKAGAAAKLNISEFPIKISDFEQLLRFILTSKGASVSLKEFIHIICNRFFDDTGSAGFGLNDEYQTTFDTKTGVKTVKAKKKITETQIMSNIDARLRLVGIDDGVFKHPIIDIIVETVPYIEKNVRKSDDRSIMKIHFFDRVMSQYDQIEQMIISARNENIMQIHASAQLSNNDNKDVHKKLLQKAVNDGILKKISSTSSTGQIKSDIYEIDTKKLNEFMHDNMPSILYGTATTGIKHASFETMQDPTLSTINMQRANKNNNPLSPPGLIGGGLPLRTMPAKLNLTTIGCPFISYMQQFFVDFQTNTTVDNIYGVNTLTHTIEDGKFETKMSLVPIDAYGQYESLLNVVGVIAKLLDKKTS